MTPAAESSIQPRASYSLTGLRQRGRASRSRCAASRSWSARPARWPARSSAPAPLARRGAWRRASPTRAARPSARAGRPVHRASRSACCSSTSSTCWRCARAEAALLLNGLDGLRWALLRALRLRLPHHLVFASRRPWSCMCEREHRSAQAEAGAAAACGAAPSEQAASDADARPRRPGSLPPVPPLPAARRRCPAHVLQPQRACLCRPHRLMPRAGRPTERRRRGRQARPGQRRPAWRPPPRAMRLPRSAPQRRPRRRPAWTTCACRRPRCAPSAAGARGTRRYRRPRRLHARIDADTLSDIRGALPQRARRARAGAATCLARAKRAC